MKSPSKFTNLNQEKYFPVLIFALALILRLIYDSFLRKHFFFYDHTASDVQYYQDWAQEILVGNFWGNKVFSGLPLYPYFLAVVKGLTLNHLFLVRLVHSMLGSLNCVLVYFIARAIFPIAVARLAAILCATNFILIFYDWLMMPVTLLITLALFAVFLLLRQELLKSPRQWFIFGLLLGLGCLGDPKLLIFIFSVGIVILLRRHQPLSSRILKILLPLGLGVLLILLSVTLRNRIIGGDWTFISAQSGLSFYVGNNPNASGIYENPEFIRPTHGGQDEDQKIVAQAISSKTLTPAAVSRFWQERALRFIKENPTVFSRLLLKKSILFLIDDERADDIDLILQRDWKYRLDFNPFFIICPLALLGLFLTWRTSENTKYLNLLIASQFAMTLIFFMSSRHRTTILPILLIYQAYSLVWFFDQLRHQRFREVLFATVFIVIFLILFPPRFLDQPTLDFLRYAKTGPVYEQRKDYAKAQTYYQKALAIRPLDTNTLFNMGNSYLFQDNFSQAKDYYQKALAICPYNVDAQFNLGYIYEQTGDWENAVHLYQKIVDLQPESLDVHFRLANIFAKLQRCPEAQEQIKFITRQQPKLFDKLREYFKQCY